jgi:hypothetical protein
MDVRRTSSTTLERRICELERLARDQSRELRIQFERIAQLQAEYDILRSRAIRRRPGTKKAFSAAD